MIRLRYAGEASKPWHLVIHCRSEAVLPHQDLILLDGNPLEEISAVRRATLVMKGNTVYRPDKLYKAIGVKPFVASTGI